MPCSAQISLVSRRHARRLGSGTHCIRFAAGRFSRCRIPHEDKRFIWDEQNREQRRFKRQRIRSQKAAEASAPSHQELKRVAASLPTTHHATTDIACEEREPGELDADEADALSGV